MSGNQIQCYHCGETCTSPIVSSPDKQFCCEGCRMIYELLNQKGMCNYYALNEKPGATQRSRPRKDKFSFLDDDNIRRQLVSFTNGREEHVTFYLPQIHCSSCLWLLENLHQVNPAVISGRVNFQRKEISVVYDPSVTSLKDIACLLADVGYEPYISLQDLQHKKPGLKKDLIYKLGVAGFCFGNIMLLSFPEYLGLETDKYLQSVFRSLSLLLALPVLLFSAQPFYISAWKSLTHKFLNIDAPIVLAIFVTFTRSVIEVFSGTGAGYFDSMTGIVFFMLVGRLLQERTYTQLSFDRDFTSYFPLAVSVMKGEQEVPVALPDIKPGDCMIIHNEELIPADGILTAGRALIDYSFVTGESLPVLRETGEIVYAGGKQTGGNIEVFVIKEVVQSYLTRLWNRDDKTSSTSRERVSFVHLLSRYFTYVVFAIALLAAAYWMYHDPSRVWVAVTAVLIIACPCALLLTNSFTNGNILRILASNKFYLRNAQTIEDIAKTDHIVFDKTGTLTSSRDQQLVFEGKPLPETMQCAISALAAQSTHPLCRVLVKNLPVNSAIKISGHREEAGKGLEGIINGDLVAIGSREFVTSRKNPGELGTKVFVSVENKLLGCFNFSNHYRTQVPPLVEELSKDFELSVISGDNATERQSLQSLFGNDCTILFNRTPADKLEYISALQQEERHVMMIGDGLNDAGALKQSDVGIAITEDTNNFTPASDAILEASHIGQLNRFIRLCRANRQVVIATFILSIVYNIVGIFFAVQGVLSPLIAAVLMPASSISILLITFGSTNLIARSLGLHHPVKPSSALHVKS